MENWNKTFVPYDINISESPFKKNGINVHKALEENSIQYRVGQLSVADKQ